MKVDRNAKIAGMVVLGFAILIAASLLTTKVRKHVKEQAIAAQRLEDGKKLVSKINNSIQVSDTGRYVRQVETAVDPWGTEIKVKFEEGEVTDNAEVRSAGPDKVFETEDDIVDYRTRASLSVATGTVSEEVKRQFRGVFHKEEE